MPLVRDVMGSAVTGPGGRALGEVKRVLFHPSEARVVGFEVVPPPLLLLVPRPVRYLPIEDVERWGDRVLRTRARRLPSRRAGERRLGFSWDATVVWRGMPVAAVSGREVGRVHDAGFTKVSGSLTRLKVTAGAVNDAAFGTIEAPAASVIGFDGASVVVDDSVALSGPEGGAIRAAGAAAAGVGEMVRPALEEAAVKTVSAGLAAAKVVSGSQAGRAAGRAWHGVKGFVREALEPEPDADGKRERTDEP